MIRAVVVNYNGGTEVVASVRALLASDVLELEVVVVDNGSTDGSAEALEQQVRVVRSPSNLGYPVINQVVEDLTGVDAVAIVNPDAEVAPDCLRLLSASLAADPSVGAACPRILLAGDYRELTVSLDGSPRDAVELLAVDAGQWHLTGPRVRRRWNRGVAWTVGDGSVLRTTADRARLTVRSHRPLTMTLNGTAHAVDRRPSTIEVGVEGPATPVVQNAGSLIGEHGLGHNRGYHQPDGAAWHEPVDVPAWCGAAVLLRASYLTEVGLLDPRWFLYYEDTDLSWRGLLRGWRYRYVPEAVVRHAHSSTIGHGSALYDVQHERNRILTVTKNAPRAAVVGTWRNALALLLQQIRADVVARLRDHRAPELVPTARRLRALAGALRLTPAVLADRRRVRAAATVRDSDLPVLGRWHEPTGQE